MNDDTSSDLALDVLLIDNLADLEAAVSKINDLDKSIIEALNGVIEEFIKINTKQIINAKIDNQYFQTQLVPKSWITDEDGAVNFHSHFLIGDKRDEDYSKAQNQNTFYVTGLLNLTEDSYGFRWILEKNPMRSKSKWKKFLAAQPKAMESLLLKGFKHEEPWGTFFLEFKLDRATLSQAVKDKALEDAAGPLRDALRIVSSAVADFDALLAEAKRGS